MDDTPSRDRFLPKMLQLALPIAGQQLVFSSLNVVEVLMLGQLGDAPVAAISLGKQVFFLYFETSPHSRRIHGGGQLFPAGALP